MTDSLNSGEARHRIHMVNHRFHLFPMYLTCVSHDSNGGWTIASHSSAYLGFRHRNAPRSSDVVPEPSGSHQEAIRKPSDSGSGLAFNKLLCKCTSIKSSIICKKQTKKIVLTVSFQWTSGSQSKKEKVTELEHLGNTCHHLQHAAESSPFPTFFDALALHHWGADRSALSTIYPSEEPSFHGEAKPQSVRARSVPVNLYLNKVQQIQQCLKHVWVYSFARTFAFDLAQLEDAASWKCQKMWFQSWWIFWILIFGCIKPSIVSI